MSVINIEVNPLPEGSYRVSSNFGHRVTSVGSSNHLGIDLACAAGTPIFAVSSGQVVTAIYSNSYGNYVVIRHAGTWTTLYAHMQTFLVSAGQYVDAGQQIGYVDSTGVSTGNHLHFEVWEGTSSTTAINPALVLNGNSAFRTGDYSLISTSGGSDPANLQVAAETTFNITQQPLLAFLDIYVGDQRLTLLPPQYIVSFEFTRLPLESGGGGEFILSIFDTQWEALEYLFSNNFNNVKFRYGYVSGNQSRIYNAQVSTYTIDYNNEGVFLNIKGITLGVMKNLINITENLNTQNPTEAAKQICESVGWQVREENFHPSLDIEFTTRDTLSIVNERPATYIINKLAPLAIRTSDGLGGYRFYLDDSESPAVAHFKPKDFLEGTKKTYMYMKGVDSPIIDLQLTVNGVFGGTGTSLVSTGLSSTLIDPNTKEETTLSENIDSVRVYATGEYSHTNSSQYVSQVDPGASSKSQMNAILNYRLTSPLSAYEGLMTIIGDPTIEMGDTIRLLVVTETGNLHHTAGLYIVDSISDSIEQGSMKTTLKIIKSENLSEGVQVVNYRTLLK